MRKSGMEATTALELATKTLQMGKIHMDEYAEATQLAIYAQNTFRNDMLDTKQKLEFVSYAAKESVMDIADLETAFKHAAGPMQAVNGTFEELVSILAAVSQVGGKIGISARQFRALILQLIEMSANVKNLNEEQREIWDKYFSDVITNGKLSVTNLITALERLGKAAKEGNTTIGSELVKLGLTMRAENFASLASLEAVREKYAQLMEAGYELAKGGGAAFNSIEKGMAEFQKTMSYQIGLLTNTFYKVFLSEENLEKLDKMTEKLVNLFIVPEEELGKAHLQEWVQEFIDLLMQLSDEFDQNMGQLVTMIYSVLPVLKVYLGMIKTIGDVTSGLGDGFIRFMVNVITLTKVLSIAEGAMKPLISTQRLITESMEKQNLTLQRQISLEKINAKAMKVEAEAQKQATQAKEVDTKATDRRNTAKLQEKEMTDAATQSRVNETQVTNQNTIAVQQNTQSYWQRFRAAWSELKLIVRGKPIHMTENQLIYAKTQAVNTLATAEARLVKIQMVMYTGFAAFLSVWMLWEQTGHDVEKTMFGVALAIGAVVVALVAMRAALGDWTAAAKVAATVGIMTLAVYSAITGFKSPEIETPEVAASTGGSTTVNSNDTYYIDIQGIDTTTDGSGFTLKGW